MPRKSKQSKERFVGFARDMIESNEFVALSPRSKALLFDIAVQYNGYNNGALVASWAYMRDLRGWRSKSGLSKSRKELVDTGFLLITDYQGRYTKLATYYAITWRSIDATNHSNPTVAAPGTWKKNRRTVFWG